MAYEKAFQNHYHELDANTQYRFAEIELRNAVSSLITLFKPKYTPRLNALNTLYDYLIPKNLQNPEMEEQFVKAFSSHHFAQPGKHEVIYYLIARNHSYAKIRDLTNASFNTIAKMRFDNPIYYPVFEKWDEEILNRWNDLKTIFNLFNENLAHMKE
jgi:hypothetical protein